MSKDNKETKRVRIVSFANHQIFELFPEQKDLTYPIDSLFIKKILDKITSGKGTLEDIDNLEELCYSIKDSALCGLGQTAPNPILSTIEHFRDEYEAHIIDKRCPAGVCKALLNYVIDPEKCKGCTKCARNCPVGAISGAVKQPHVIDPAKCIKCGACMENCAFGAISRK